jgi:hypothetical protein
VPRLAKDFCWTASHRHIDVRVCLATGWQPVAHIQIVPLIAHPWLEKKCRGGKLFIARFVHSTAVAIDKWP